MLEGEGVSDVLLRAAVAADATALSALALASKRHWGYRESLIALWRDELEITPDTIARLAELDGDVRTVATGGLASTIVPHCDTVTTVDEYLTLDGLRLIYDMNAHQ